ncbi:amino acid/amide ABC transporter substrate-binding protein (HAAT family) [Micromonospora kangleipakensis]|uniref:Amino acid/amide ABC transporter substrate-binding protein (HAAT family) n=2 Tax=Micromonospora kangleipakensis TaxID=1077942 RepID=A0A4Q8BAW3_9ACTN|nr:amino acid/amide ABC transporter substrate-binding protein (HAAT family) [Micromonospora kangleipakensis]
MSLNRSRLAATAAAALILVGAVAGCRGTDTPTTTTSAGMKTDIGVTAEPCPQAIDTTKGCIYLGTISDLTVGPFAPLAVPITKAQAAFWNRVNKAGGIGGYEIDVTKYVKDNKYNPQTHNEVYQEIKPSILALAQTLGSPTTAAIIEDLVASKIVAAPASWTSDWAFQDVILESGANYCVESMNAVDFAKSKNPALKNVMAVHYAGDYGDDAAAGVKYAAEKLGLTYTDVKTDPGADKQAAAIAAIVAGKPDLVILTTAPTEAATIVGTAVAQGFRGMVIGTSPTWNPALNGSPAAPALAAVYLQSGPWQSWGADTPGHKAMREALTPTPSPLSDGYTSGWVWSYPLKAALEKAAANKDLTRAGLLAAAKSLTSVDYEGMLPAGSGNYAAGPDKGQVRVTVISKPDKAAPTGVTEVQKLTAGPTATGFNLSKACYK